VLPGFFVRISDVPPPLGHLRSTAHALDVKVFGDVETELEREKSEEIALQRRIDHICYKM
jgi:hypothetical protein